MPPPLWLCVGEGNRKRRRKKRKPPAARQLPGWLERTITPCRPSAPESNRAPAPAPPAPAPVQPLRPCPARPRRRPPPPYPLPPLPTPPQPAHVSGGNQPRQRRPRPLEEDGCDDDEDWDDDGQQKDDVVPVAAVPAFVPRAPIPVPPRPVLPRRNRASPSPQRAAPVQETAVIRVPPRPVLARGRKASAPAPASSAPGRIEVPPRPRLPMQRSMGQTHAKRGEADELGGVCRDGKREAAMREEEQKRSSLAEDLRRKEAQRELKGKAKLTDQDIEEEEEEAATTTRRQERQPQPHVEAVQHEVQEPLAVFGPQLLGSDSFHADLERQKQIEASLEELRQLRESERWKAIERQRAQGKPTRTANVEALGMRHPHGGGVTPRSSSMPAARHTSKASDRQGDTRETPRQEGVFLVRALDHFKGNMRFEHETKGNRKRRQLRFKLHDVIRVTSVNTEDGLYFGTLIKTGKTGWFPYYYVVHLA